ncbi:MAG: radical SAM protein [Planctomycetota bacterium]|nr:radical SAM protein [Planctomycetota bacterium]
MPSSYRPPAEHPSFSGLDAGLLQAVVHGQARLTVEQGMELFRGMGLPELGRWADGRARAIHGDVYRTYVIDRNINYTNVCNARCTFCAFRRDGHEADAYTLEPQQIYDKIAELSAIGGTQILMQGGMNPALPLSWYLDLLSGIKSRFPHVHVHAFSPPEFIEFVHFFNPPGDSLEAKIRFVMVQLRDAGLDSVPGGGGEIFSGPVRRKIGLGKCDAEAWLTTMYVAHTLGMFTSATMMFGHIEGYADRVHHMMLVRQWQDRALREGGQALEWSNNRAETPGGGPAPAQAQRQPAQALGAQADGVSANRTTEHVARPDQARRRRFSGVGHYKAFISWPFQRENTPLGRVKDWGRDPTEWSDDARFPGDVVADAYDFGRIDGRSDPRAEELDFKTLGQAAAEFGRRVRMSGASDYLRTQALSRLFLDNIYSIGASWVTMGPHIGQVALAYGASDMGSVMMEENVVSSAGTTYCLDEPVLCRLIRGAGFIPAQRDNVYDILRIHAGADAPDLRVEDWSQHRARRMHQQAPKQPKVGLTVKAQPTAAT